MLQQNYSVHLSIFSSVFLVLGHHPGTTIQKVFKIVLDENAEKHRNSVHIRWLAPAV